MKTTPSRLPLATTVPATALWSTAFVGAAAARDRPSVLPLDILVPGTLLEDEEDVYAIGGADTVAPLSVSGDADLVVFFDDDSPFLEPVCLLTSTAGDADWYVHDRASFDTDALVRSVITFSEISTLELRGRASATVGRSVSGVRRPGRGGGVPPSATRRAARVRAGRGRAAEHELGR